MMIPSAAPAILLLASLRRHAGAAAVGPALLFAGGYLAAWTTFSLAATSLQWWLAENALLSPAMASEGSLLAGALFIAAGIYQLTPLKAACLTKCRDPARFLVERRRDGALGAFLMGLDHGTYCVGCCWALMALLFAFGVMNLLWVAAIAAFVLVEKLLPVGARVASLAGIAMMGVGVALFIL
jgi:predicted metal-binding membrane protein